MDSTTNPIPSSLPTSGDYGAALGFDRRRQRADACRTFEVRSDRFSK